MFQIETVAPVGRYRSPAEMTASTTNTIDEYIRPAPAGDQMFLAWVDPTVARPNPRNWKRHPDDQLGALDALIWKSGAGWADPLVINWRRLSDGWTPDQAHPVYVDGHARRRLAAQRGEKVLAVVRHWTPDQERMVLATLDLVTRLVTIDQDRAKAVVKMATADDFAILALYQRLARDADLGELLGEDGQEDGDISQGSAADPGAGSDEGTDPADVPERPRVFRFGEWSSVMSPSEWKALDVAASDYSERNGTLKGFAGEVLLS